MLRAYGPNCDGSVIDATSGQRIPDDATWIDLEDPTREEDKLVDEQYDSITRQCITLMMENPRTIRRYDRDSGRLTPARRPAPRARLTPSRAAPCRGRPRPNCVPNAARTIPIIRRSGR